ncbi:MAG: hypothetical protein V7603_2044 [Micromonosporaceae bacterium]
MSVAIFEHHEPWTEEEFLALGETSDRIELFDGSLLVSPSPTPLHQHLSRLLANALEPAVEVAGLEIYLMVNVRLRPNRIPIPDLVITQPIDLTDPVIDVADVELICEITSSNPGTDRIMKMNYYADAGIRWYLIVEPKAPTATLYRLDREHYIEEAAAQPGQILHFAAPIQTDLDPAVLLPGRGRSGA